MIRLAHWIESSGLSRSTAYELLKLLGIQPLPRRVFGFRKPISHLTADQISQLSPWVARLKAGMSFSQVRTEFFVCNDYMSDPHQSVQQLLETLRWIASVNATDREYQAAARSALKQWGQA